MQKEDAQLEPDAVVMCVGNSSARFGLVSTLKYAGIHVVVVTGGKKPPAVIDILMPLNVPELPKFEIAMEPKYTRPYWRRFEKRRNT